MGATVQKLPLTSIRTDGGTQPRAQLDLLTVTEYVAAMEDGAIFPPVVVFREGDVYWLADGFHRVKAANHLGRTEFEAEIREGSRRDAVLYSVGANAAHGLRRTNEDKRNSVMKLLRDEEWAKWSDREIARRCGVHHDLASRLRGELSGGNRQIERQVERNGTVYTLNTERIGRAEKPASAVSTFIPEPEPEPGEPFQPDPEPEPTPSVPPALARAIVTAEVERQVRAELRAQELLEPAEAEVAEVVVSAPPIPVSRQPQEKPGIQKAVQMTIDMERLANAPLTGKEFKKEALPYTLHRALQFAPRVRALLEEIEKETDDEITTIELE